jgi:hypothetical protein
LAIYRRDPSQNAVTCSALQWAESRLACKQITPCSIGWWQIGVEKDEHTDQACSMLSANQYNILHVGILWLGNTNTYYKPSILLLPLALQPFVGFGFLRQVTLVSDFIARCAFQGKVAGLMPNPQPGGPVPRIYISLGMGNPAITLGHWVAQVPWHCHFLYPQMWARGINCLYH